MLKKLYICLTFLVYFGVPVVLTWAWYSHETMNTMYDAEIEYKIGKETVMPSLTGGFKRIYWRIKLEDCEWWQKPFDYWREAYFVTSGHVYGSKDVPDGELDATRYILFNPEQFKKLKNECHTLGEMQEHIKKADEEFERCNYKKRKESLGEESNRYWMLVAGSM